MDRLTRKELKQDRFAQEVSRTVAFFEAHRKQVIRAGIALLALILIAAGALYYQRRQQTVRQEALRKAVELLDAPVGQGAAPGITSFLSEDSKREAVTRAFSELASRYSGSREAAIAEYYLGVIAVSQGKSDEAIKHLTAALRGDKEIASLANLTLADLYASQGKTAEAEKILRALAANPTVLVPKEEATIALARVLAASKPDEARKLLEPLRTSPGAVGRAAIAAYGELFANR